MEEKTSSGNQQQQIERPIHYMYLKSFRTEQCQSFLQHKCTAHRPYTCFNWHFLNQRRRRPKKLRDGTFNYSPDVYCTQYDETTGICPTGDNCPFLHRTAGDTERRYHLRYYKTSKCIYDTDSKGYCVKNGPHCAFAHGDDDLRQPVFDVREIQALERKEAGIDKIIPEDSLWHDKTFVVNTYKTDPCNKPPKTCRQGYACPYYHSNRDRRRGPVNIKYRSIPCPSVKHGDEWGDPSTCENGDECQYCHTRTEQQFHPEIYKSCKCNDMYQTGKCPRGPFCAFSHDVTRSQTDTDDDGGTPSSSRMTNSSATSPIGTSSANAFTAASVLNSVIANSSNRQRQGSTGTPTSVSSGFKGSNINELTAADDGGNDLFEELDKLHMPEQATSNIVPIGRKVSLESGRQDSPTTRDDAFHIQGDIFPSVFNSFGSPDSSVLMNQGQMSHLHGQPHMLPNLLTPFGPPMPISTNNNPQVKMLDSSSSIVDRSDNENQLLRDKLSESNSKLKSLQETWAQLKGSCDSWKKEAQEMAEKYRQAEHDRERTLTQRDKIQSKLDMIIQSNVGGRNIDENNIMSINLNIEELTNLSSNQLRNLQHHLRNEIQKVEIALSQYQRH